MFAHEHKKFNSIQVKKTDDLAGQTEAFRIRFFSANVHYFVCTPVIISHRSETMDGKKCEENCKCAITNFK